MREEFEKLPEIAANLRNVVFDKGSNEYLPKKMGYVIHEFSAYYLNGALYAFQEQQKSHQQETERLKTQLLAAEAEVARLQSGIDELKKTCIKVLGLGISDEFERGWDRAHHGVLRTLEEITGADK